MRTRPLYRLAALGVLMLGLMSLFSALAAANNVPASGKLDTAVALTANNLKPPECAGINLSNIVIGNTTDWTLGTSSNDLVLGTTVNDIIGGMDGSDCVLGGAGNDAISGDDWTGNYDDVLLGGNGDDSLYGNGPNGVTTNDTCYGGPGNDTFYTCKTTSQ